MTLTHDLASQFRREVQVRGSDYVHRVVILDASDRAVRALVRGADEYAVDLARTGNDLTVACGCPYFLDHGPCKHLWATLLVAEERGYLSADGPIGRLVLDRSLVTFEPADLPAAAAPSRRAGQPAAWRALLDELKSQPSRHVFEPLERSEVVYVLDPNPLLHGNGLMLDLALRPTDRPHKPRAQRIELAQIASLPDADRRILSALIGAREAFTGYSESLPSRARLIDPLPLALVPEMCATGRCYLRTEVPAEPALLAWDARLWQPWLVVRYRDRETLVVTAELRAGDERVALAAPKALLAGGLVLFADRAAQWEVGDAFAWLAHLRQTPELLVPAEDGGELVERLHATPLPHLELPDELRIEELHVAPRPRLRIRPPARQWSTDRLSAELSFAYAGHEVAHGKPGRALVQTEPRRIVVRDARAEAAAAAQLAPLAFRSEWSAEGPRFSLSPRQLDRAVRALVESGWLVEAQGKRYRAAGFVDLEVRSGIDWFELHGGAQFDGTHVQLPALLAALGAGAGSVRLDDGSFGLLPADWLARNQMLLQLGEPTGDHLRFAASQAGLLDVLLQALPAARVDEKFAHLRARLARFESVAPVDAPPGFQGALRDYQREGLGWLLFMRELGLGGCLADDMGLGKTVQVLALLQSLRAAKKPPLPSLVVLPRSLVFNWIEQAQRFAPELRVLDHSGPARLQARLEDYDLVITTYGTLRRDAPRLRDVDFEYVILDEAQAIKNARSESAKAARLLRGRHRLALSGTPVENHLGELWSLLEFLNPGMLGASSAFAGASANPDPETRTLLARAVRPFILRRTKEQVARDLPAKLEETIHCELEPVERKQYDELRAHYRAALLDRIDDVGLGRSKVQVLEALLRLRQAACHPGLLDAEQLDAPSAKLTMLLDRLREVIAEGHKALVFSQFTSLLAIVRRVLDAESLPYEYLDGKTRDRAARVERFQGEDGPPLFLISLKAGGLGLNLTAADYVFLLDPWWNPAVEAQAVDRTHRIGQTRPVFAYRLIARDTVEEKVLELQQRKRALADAILGAQAGPLAQLTRQDLELLLS
jgi:hypothetical protein